MKLKKSPPLILKASSACSIITVPHLKHPDFDLRDSTLQLSTSVLNDSEDLP